MANAERAAAAERPAQPLPASGPPRIDIDKLLRLIDAHRALVSGYKQVAARYRQAHADLGRLQVELLVDATSQEQGDMIGKPLQELEATGADAIEAAGLSVSSVRRLIAAHRLVESLHAEMIAQGAQVRESVQLTERLIEFARLHGEHVVI